MRRRGAPTWVKRAIGFGAMAGAAVVALLSFVPPQLPFHKSAHLKVEVASFGEMNPESRVELSGVRVGSIDAIDYRDGHAVLSVSIEPGYLDKIHADATGEVKPTGLLGPKFLSLSSGTSGQMRDGSVIPLSRTRVSTDFDQVLESLQPDVRMSLKTVFVELGTASDGRGADVNEAIKALHEAQGNLQTTTQTLANRNPEVGTFFDQSEILNREMQFAPNAQNIADTDKVLRALVAVEDDLGGGIDHTASVLDELNRALSGGGSANLATTLSKAPAAIQKANRFLDAATPIISGTAPNIPDLMTAVAEGKRVVSGQDANGHYVRVLFLIGTCTAGLPNVTVPPLPLPVPTPPAVTNLNCSSPQGAGGALPGLPGLPVPTPSLPVGAAPSGSDGSGSGGGGAPAAATPDVHSQLTDQQLIDLFLK